MTTIEPLGPDALYRRTDPGVLDFETTADVGDGSRIVGQVRAADAVRFGVGIAHQGFNIFALGPTGVDKRHLVAHFVAEAAATRPLPPDICYVHNFAEPYRPHVLQLPPGTGGRLRRDMAELTEEMRSSLARALESDEYLTRRRVLEQEAEEEPEQALEELRKRAKERRYALLRTPVGLVFAALKDDDEILPPEEFKALPDEERKRIEADIEELQGEVQQILRQMPRWQRQLRESTRELNREVIGRAIGHLLDALGERYAELPQVVSFLEAVRGDIIASAGDLIQSAQQQEGPPEQATPTPPPMKRYQVNVLVDHAESPQAPVVEEDNPTYANLIGRVEHIAQMGALVTDFTLVRPGALHRANGGFLVLDARAVLTQPYAWDALKRCLRTSQVRIESLGQALSLISTVSLEPEPMPLDVKVVLIGEPMLYYLLCAHDPEFQQLFKVAADFDDRIVRDGDGQRLYAALIASLTRRGDLRPFDRTAVSRLIEHGARMAADSERLSAHVEGLSDLMKEADFLAARADVPVVTSAEVEAAIAAQIFRAGRIRARTQESIVRGIVHIDTEGEAIGQVNGLSVVQLGGYTFGRPNRITAQVRVGSGEVVDIEREVELGGPIHSKGVLILTGFLGGRYASTEPLSLAATLVFEQSYGGVEGDSASSAELYALLSAIGRIPLRQSVAVTGSVDQHGSVQAIGGVNEKIEGFFDLCAARGLTGEQGVIIPADNVQHLMLRSDVVEACAAGRFAVYPVSHVDQGMQILSGLPAGERGADGDYPDGTVSERVTARLTELARQRKSLFEESRRKEME